MRALRKVGIWAWDRLGDISLVSWLYTQFSAPAAWIATIGGSMIGLWAWLQDFGPINAGIIFLLAMCLLVIATDAWARIRDPRPEITVGHLAFADRVDQLAGINIQEWTSAAALFSPCTVVNRGRRRLDLQFSLVLRSKDGRVKIPAHLCYVSPYPTARFSPGTVSIAANAAPLVMRLAFVLSGERVARLTGGERDAGAMPGEGFVFTIIARDLNTGRRTLRIDEPVWAT